MSTKSEEFAGQISPNFDRDPDESVFDALFREYERVVFRSIITSFGLDLFIQDQYGGDVDTIYNVRKVGIDPKMQYKSVDNSNAYDNRGEYSHKDLEGPGTNFQRMKHEARARYREDPENNTVQDAYEDKPLGFLGKSKGHPTDKSAELDHVIAGKTADGDRGRVLAGLSTVELVDAEDNLKWTNEHLNKSMGAKEIPDYIAQHPELDEDTKARMMDAYEQAKASYEKKIAKAYYFDFSNPNCREFYKQTAIASVNRGLEMGVRQAVGFLITEFWFSVKDALAESDGTFEGAMNAISTGIKAGSENAKEKYKCFFVKFGEGVMSGILASVTSIFTNTFLTTSENVGRILRQAWSSMVEATSILLFNSKDQYLCDRMTSAAKVLAAGASVIIGTTVQEQVNAKLKTVPIPNDLKQVIAIFSGSLCTGLLTVSLLFYIDNGPFTQFLQSIYGEGTRKLEEQGILFKRYCAELEKIDVARLQFETDYIRSAIKKLESTDDQFEINAVLHKTTRDLGLPSVLGGYSLDERMNDKNWVLKF